MCKLRFTLTLLVSVILSALLFGPSNTLAREVEWSFTEDSMKSSDYWYRFEGEIVVDDIGYIDVSNETNFLASVTGYYGDEKELVIPDEVCLDGYYYDVVGVESKAFYRSELTSITLPSKIKYIGTYAFAGAANLTSFQIPNDVNAFREGVFYGCASLSELIPAEYPESIEYIGKAAFANTAITGAAFMVQAKYIGENAFYGCSKLRSISLGKKLEYLGIGAFSFCNEVESVKVSKSNRNYFASYGVIYKGNSEESIAVSAPGAKGSRTLKTGCVSVASYCFEGNSRIETVMLPKSCAGVSSNAFYASSISTLSINRAYLEKDALTGADSLMFFKASKYNNYYRCSDNILVLKEGSILYMWPSAKGSIAIPEYVLEIAPFAFRGNTLITDVTIPSNVKSIGEGAFSGCVNLKKVEFLSRSVKLLTDHRKQISNGKAPYYAIFYGADWDCRFYVPFDEKADSSSSIETRLKLHIPETSYVLHR